MQSYNHLKVNEVSNLLSKMNHLWGYDMSRVKEII